MKYCLAALREKSSLNDDLGRRREASQLWPLIGRPRRRQNDALSLVILAAHSSSVRYNIGFVPLLLQSFISDARLVH